MKANEIQIAPSILSADFSRLSREIEAVELAGADLIHLDVMDGHFVPNLTIGAGVVAALRKCTDLPFDVHLMIEDADRYIDSFTRAGANMISVHVEACDHLHRTLARIKEGGALAGVAINPATDINGLFYVLSSLDFILVMSVNPGFGGQAFIPSALDKIKNLANFLREVGSRAVIEVDGGIGPDNAGELAEAGASILVAGSAIFHHPPYEKVINSMRTAAIEAAK